MAKQLTANDLRINDAQKKSIEREVKSLLSIINDEIKLAFENGNEFAIVNLPPVFHPVSNMSYEDMAKKIYASILMDLKKRDFKILFERNSDRAVLKISWLTEEDLAERQREDEILAYYSKPLSKRDIKDKK